MTRWRRLTAVAAVLLLTLVAACGDDSPRAAVADAGASVGRIHSGVLHLTLELSTAADDPNGRVGFELDGPFDLGTDSPLPIADLVVTNLSDPASPTTEFLSTGQTGFIVDGGVGYQLEPAQTARLARSGDQQARSLAGLDLSSWVVDPQAQPATTLGSEGVDRVTGQVDPVAALNGIARLAGQLGAGTDTSIQVTDSEAERVRAAVTSSSFEVLTGTEDDLLRSLSVTVEFEAPAATNGAVNGAVLEALRRVGHVTLTIQLRLERPNSAVTVQAPATVKPIAELPKK